MFLCPLHVFLHWQTTQVEEVLQRTPLIIQFVCKHVTSPRWTRGDGSYVPVGGPVRFSLCIFWRHRVFMWHALLPWTPATSFWDSSLVIYLFAVRKETLPCVLRWVTLWPGNISCISGGAIDSIDLKSVWKQQYLFLLHLQQSVTAASKNQFHHFFWRLDSAVLYEENSCLH